MWKDESSFAVSQTFTELVYGLRHAAEHTCFSSITHTHTMWPRRSDPLQKTKRLTAMARLCSISQERGNATENKRGMENRKRCSNRADIGRGPKLFLQTFTLRQQNKRVKVTRPPRPQFLHQSVLTSLFSPSLLFCSSPNLPFGFLTVCRCAECFTQAR